MIAIVDENNRLFPHRPVSDRSVSISTGLMNLFGAGVGGVPCATARAEWPVTCASEREQEGR
jgi:hypothetical protein